MANHYKRCSTTDGSSTEIQKLIQTKIDADDTEQDGQVINTVVWEANGDNMTDYVDESVPLESVQQNVTMQIINDDIKRHRKSSSSKPRLNFPAIDAQLSSFLIGCNLTFDVVDSPHFKKFVAALNSDYPIPSCVQLKARVISQLQAVETSGKAKSSKRRYYDYSASDSDN